MLARIERRAAWLTVVAAAVKRAVSCPIGINVLANGAIQALAIAKAAME